MCENKLLQIQEKCPYKVIDYDYIKCKFSKTSNYPICRPSLDCEGAINEN